MKDAFIRQNELCRALSIDRQTAYIWEREGKLPPRTPLVPGGRIRGWWRHALQEQLGGDLDGATRAGRHPTGH